MLGKGFCTKELATGWPLMVSGIHQSKKGVVLWLLLFHLIQSQSSRYLIRSMMMLIHDVGCGVKSLTHPLTFLLINLGTASEI